MTLGGLVAGWITTGGLVGSLPVDWDRFRWTGSWWDRFQWTSGWWDHFWWPGRPGGW